MKKIVLKKNFKKLSIFFILIIFIEKKTEKYNNKF